MSRTLLRDEIVQLRKDLEELYTPGWMTLPQAEAFLGFPKDINHRAIKRFLREHEIKVKLINGNRIRVSRRHIEREMAEGLEHAI